eukprot:UN11144
MTFFWLLSCILFIHSVNGEFCTYKMNERKLKCGTMTDWCTTQTDNVHGSKGPTPPGDYRIGQFRIHHEVGWFNLYPKRDNHPATYWDYSTHAPDRKCRGGFGLHFGSRSAGCITVLDKECWKKVEEQVKSQSYQSKTTYKCQGCSAKWVGSGYSCWRTTTFGSRQLGPTLKVIKTSSSTINLQPKVH